MTDFFEFALQPQMPLQTEQQWMPTFPGLPLVEQQQQQQQLLQQFSIQDAADSSSSTPKRRGRKAVNAEPATKRIAQVRSAARAYRERKEKYVADLETTVKQLQSASNVSEMTQRLQHLEAENSVLRQMAFSFAPLQNFQQPPSNDISPRILASQLYGSLAQMAPPSSSSSDSPDESAGLLDDNLFSPPLSFPMASFKQTHSNMDYSLVQPELASLLDAPLVDPPQAKDLIVQMFASSKEKLKAIPSLILEGELIDELFDCYVTFVSFRTDETTPTTCTATYGKIQVLQGKLIDKCMLCPNDLDSVMRLFVTIKHEFLIEVYPHEHLPLVNCKREPVPAIN